MQTTYEILDSTTNWNKPGKPSMVRISKQGVIRFTVAAVQLLQLKKDMRLAFLLCHTDKEIIYIYESPTGLPLKKDGQTKSKSGVAMYCCGRQHATRLLQFFSIKANFKTFDINNEQSEVNGKRCWFILKDKIHKPVKWRKQK